MGPPELPPIIFYWDDWDPEWSPDGSALVIKSNRHSYDPTIEGANPLDQDLYLLDTLGNATRLTVGMSAGGGSWSADGRVAFASGTSLWITSRDGSELHEAFVHERPVYDVAWSPAGGAIAFAWTPGCSATGCVPFRISVVDIESGSVSLLSDPAVSSSSPSWSADGSQVVFMRQGGALPQIARMDANGSNVAVLLEDAFLFDPTWSPCGDRIAYSQTVAPRTHLLRLMNADGSDIRTLTQGEQATWSPDCTRLAFIRESVDEYGYDGIDIWMIGIDGTGERKLTLR